MQITHDRRSNRADFVAPIAAARRPFLLRGRSYMRDLPRKRAVRGANWRRGSYLIQKSQSDSYRSERGQAFQPGHGMGIRFTTARSTVTMRRWRPQIVVTLAAMAALATLTTGAAAKQPRQTTEATAPREAGEPIMAIVSIK